MDRVLGLGNREKEIFGRQLPEIRSEPTVSVRNGRYGLRTDVLRPKKDSLESTSVPFRYSLIKLLYLYFYICALHEQNQPTPPESTLLILILYLKPSAHARILPEEPAYGKNLGTYARPGILQKVIF